MRFSRLLVISKAETEKPRSWWNCICDCGKELIASGAILTSGDKQSCGCLQSESCRDRFTKHGHSRTGDNKDLPSPEYYSFRTMKNRCLSPNNAKYEYYGGKGIKICDRWLDEKEGFQNFLKDMGPRPKGMSLDRKETSGNYCPDNCKWSTRAEQARNTTQNRMIEFGGRKQCITDWAHEIGVHPVTLHLRLKKNWSIEKALSTPGPTRAPPPKDESIGEGENKSEDS